MWGYGASHLVLAREGLCPQLKKFQPIRSWVWVRNSFTQQCHQMRGTGSSSRFGNMFDNCRVGWRPDGCRLGNSNRWNRVGGISTQTGRGLISWDLRLAACLEWWLFRPGTRIVTRSVPVVCGSCHHECIFTGLPNIMHVPLECWSAARAANSVTYRTNERETRSVHRICHAGRAGWRPKGGTHTKLNRTTNTAQSARYRSSPIKTDDITRSVDCRSRSGYRWWRKKTVPINKINVNREKTRENKWVDRTD